MRHPGFARLVEELEPGGRLRSVRRLKGGLGATMHVLDIEAQSGERRKVTLRRLITAYKDGTPEGARAEYARLRLVEEAGIPAPKTLLLDAEGSLFGGPALVLTYIPGDSRFRSPDPAAWTAEFAAAALRIHAVKPGTCDLSSLPVFSKEDLRGQIERFNDPVAAEDDGLAADVRAVLLANIDRIEWLEPCLIHHDFWPGNTVWYRGHLAAVIDWSEACLGDLRSDVAQCQIELAFTVDPATADRFVEAYERVSGPLPSLWFFALYRSMFALAHVSRWLVGYEDVGMKLDVADVMLKLRAYANRALLEASQHGMQTRL